MTKPTVDLNVTIAPVVVAKTELRTLGFVASNQNPSDLIQIVLTGPTNINATKGAGPADGAMNPVTTSWELTEYY
ncbi:MAG TPA: hypothetical protein PLL92_07915 [Alicycliphilus sp.]|nr:hypothetical protein [Alicycliphilus sp.]